jgi:2'-5' RNA ligase
MRPAALHLTLAFIGAVAPGRIPLLEDIAGAVRAEPFTLSLDRLGFWPQRGILWAGCHRPPAPLLRLAGALATDLRAAGFAIDHRSGADLVPHVTLARRARIASLPRLGTPVSWQVGEFSLVETHLHPSAASYKTLAYFPLTAADAG